LPTSSSNVSARGLRYGGTQEIQNHVNAGTLAAVVRGGWALEERETRNTSATYSVGNFDVLMFGTKAIAGYPDARAPVQSPTLTVLIERQADGVDKIQPLMTEIFQCAHFNILDSPIKNFATAMLAAFLRFYSDFEREMGVNNPIMKRFQEHLKKCHLTNVQLRVWSDMVRQKFESDNLMNKFDQVSKANNDIVAAIAHMHEAVLRLEESNRRILSQLEFLRNENANIKTTLEGFRQEVLDLQREDVYDKGSPPQRKRQRLTQQPNTCEASQDTILTDNDTASADPCVPTTVTQKTAFDVIACARNPYVINSSIGLDELIPQFFERQLSYSLGAAVSKQRKADFSNALEYIKRRLTREEIEVMKQKPPDSIECRAEREEWMQQKRRMSTNIIRRLKLNVHSERGGTTRESSCTLGAIGDYIKEGKLSITPPTTIQSSFIND